MVRRSFAGKYDSKENGFRKRGWMRVLFDHSVYFSSGTCMVSYQSAFSSESSLLALVFHRRGLSSLYVCTHSFYWRAAVPSDCVCTNTFCWRAAVLNDVCTNTFCWRAAVLNYVCTNTFCWRAAVLNYVCTNTFCWRAAVLSDCVFTNSYRWRAAVLNHVCTNQFCWRAAVLNNYVCTNAFCWQLYSVTASPCTKTGAIIETINANDLDSEFQGNNLLVYSGTGQCSWSKLTLSE